MAGATLFTLIDDIAALLDDISVMTKVAVEKTAGVLGDDLALNAHQVSGVAAKRELPVVWSVAKGSLVNKAILVPLALAISALAPWAVLPLLMLGGIYLCYEGVEKLVHKWLHGREATESKQAGRVEAVIDPNVDMIAFEKEKIRGAIRTDFVLSAEIIVISLGAIAKQPFMTQVGTLIAIAVIMTGGVYGLVAGIVKLDDLGIALLQKTGTSLWRRLVRGLGKFLIWLAPYLLKFLSIAGTIAMFLVGGSIILHAVAENVPAIHDGLHHMGEHINGIPSVGWLLNSLATMLTHILVGVVSGAIALLIVVGVKRLMGRRQH